MQLVATFDDGAALLRRLVCSRRSRKASGRTRGELSAFTFVAKDLEFADAVGAVAPAGVVCLSFGDRGGAVRAAQNGVDRHEPKGKVSWP